MNKSVVIVCLCALVVVFSACQKKSQTRQSLRWDSLDVPDHRMCASAATGWGDDIDTTLVADQYWIEEEHARNVATSSGTQDSTNLSDTIVAVADTTSQVQKVHPMATAGFLISLAGLSITLITPYVCVLGVIFCSIAISKINRNPQKFKGKRLATWGLLLAVTGLMISFVALLLLGL